MPTTPVPENPSATGNRHPRLPDSIVLERVRTAFHQADRRHSKRPGRPALVRSTGGTDYQVRRAMRTVESETADPNPPVTQASPVHRQYGTQSGTASPPSPPSQNGADPPDDQTPAGDEPPSPLRAAGANARQRPRPPSAWPLGLIGVAAAVAVWGGWVDLGRFTGFGMVQPLPGLVDELSINTAIVLPIGIEAYGGYALRTWLSSAALSARTRAYAGWSALASLLVGGGAQIASHLMKAHHITVAPWWVTVVVSCVPVAVLGLATGLATLVRQDTTSITNPATNPTSGATPATTDDTGSRRDDQRPGSRAAGWWPFTRHLSRR
jgi:hypothetical protein